ncbi:cysteine desulfurase family protein [Bengtsoniella intestinalis]|uniref:cysteine desulfurase family protein n=1 Tax=Bengtsoniella intestinalis TaxID=3073143 RepID=UPI00391FB571
MNIYADYAATTPMHPVAIQAMSEALSKVYGNPSSLHSLGQEAKQALDQARETFAKGLNCDPREIYFTSGGSEADTQALTSGAAMGARKNKRHIISTTIEHHAILHTLDHLESQGYAITRLAPDQYGMVTPERVEAAIREDTCLVTIMTANNEIGTINPIAEIGAVCKGRGVLFHTDGVQAVGHVAVDVQAMGVDMLSLAAHKFGGPKGVGVLYARKGMLLKPLIYGGAQERSRRSGTENLPAIISAAVAFRVALEEMEQATAHLIPMRDRLIEGLLTIPHSVLNGHATKRLPGNVHVCFEAVEGESLLLLLDAKGIQASSGSACTSGDLDPSHVLLGIGRPHEVAHGSLRLTMGHTVTQEEVDYMVQATSDVVALLRSMSPVWTDLNKGVTPHVI